MSGSKSKAPPRDYAELIKKLSEQSLKPRPTTDTELVERINEYYDFCAEHDFNINWQSLVAFCGLTMQEATDIAQGINNSIVGGAAARILVSAGEICTAVEALRAGDGTYKSFPWLIFDKKQPRPGGGYMDSPPVTIITPDALAVKSADIKQLREKYSEYAAQKRTKPAEVVEVRDENGNK